MEQNGAPAAGQQQQDDQFVREQVNAVTRTARECFHEGMLPEQLRERLAEAMRPLIRAARGVNVVSKDQQGRVAQVIADFADLPWGDCRELARRIAGVPASAPASATEEPIAPGAIKP